MSETPTPPRRVVPFGATTAGLDGIDTPAQEDHQPDEETPPLSASFEAQLAHLEKLAPEASDEDLRGALGPRRRLAQRFEIVRPLGQGGMGAVYLARDTVLGRDVAIKTLRTDHLVLAQRVRWLQTFRREATSTARLEHPHITRLYDFGLDHNVPFMVLEFLRGQPLDALVREGPLAPARVVALIKQLAEALVYAHRQGVIHRDLKPSNLFVQAEDWLKVMDFGVAVLNTDRQVLAERALSIKPEKEGNIRLA